MPEHLHFCGFQDTNRFKFPMVLDMSPYCEADVVSRADAHYELFSVVIHSGSTHSGHYTAFIRDIDDLGEWTCPVGALICFILPSYCNLYRRKVNL